MVDNEMVVRELDGIVDGVPMDVGDLSNKVIRIPNADGGVNLYFGPMACNVGNNVGNNNGIHLNNSDYHRFLEEVFGLTPEEIRRRGLEDRINNYVNRNNAVPGTTGTAPGTTGTGPGTTDGGSVTDDETETPDYTGTGTPPGTTGTEPGTTGTESGTSPSSSTTPGSTSTSPSGTTPGSTPGDPTSERVTDGTYDRGDDSTDSGDSGDGADNGASAGDDSSDGGSDDNSDDVDDSDSSSGADNSDNSTPSIEDMIKAEEEKDENIKQSVYGKGIDAFEAAEKKAGRLLKGLNRTFRQAYDAWESVFLTDGDEGVDLEKGKDDILDKAEEKFYQFILNKAVKFDGPCEKDIFKESNRVAGYCGFDKSTTMAWKQEHGRDFAFEKYMEVVAKASQGRVARTQSAPYRLLDTSMAKDVVKKCKLQGQVDHTKLELADMIGLLRAYRTNGVIAPKMIEDAPYYIKN